MSKNPDIDKVRKYLVESGYPQDGDALLSLDAVEAELAPKTFNPQELSEVLADMDLIIEQEHGSEFGARSLKEHLISLRARIESALASAEPVALGYVNPKDVADGTATLIWPKNLATADYVPVFAHAQPAAKVEAQQREALLAVMRACDAAKQPCGSDPESSTAIRNGTLASIAAIAAQGLAILKGPSLARAPASVPDDARDAARYRRIRLGLSDHHGDVYCMTFQPEGDDPISGDALDRAVDSISERYPTTPEPTP